MAPFFQEVIMNGSRVARFAAVALMAGVCRVGVAAAQEQPAMKTSVIAQTAEWQKLKALVGDWEGVTESDGKKMSMRIEMRTTGDGSAVMHVMGKGTPEEMVTVFHPDGDRILATHYCAAHNQPRMALVKGADPNALTFEFVDGTNIRPGDGHMKRLVMTIKDADHHDETWTATAGGKEYPPHVFSYSRAK
jgi:hypothetical protein